MLSPRNCSQCMREEVCNVKLKSLSTRMNNGSFLLIFNVSFYSGSCKTMELTSFWNASMVSVVLPSIPLRSLYLEQRGRTKSLWSSIVLTHHISSGDLLEALPEEMYNVSILFDMDALPEDFEPLVKKVRGNSSLRSGRLACYLIRDIVSEFLRCSRCRKPAKHWLPLTSSWLS